MVSEVDDGPGSMGHDCDFGGLGTVFVGSIRRDSVTVSKMLGGVVGVA